MTQQQRTTVEQTLAKEIERINKSIANKVRIIKDNTTKLQSDVQLLTEHLDRFKELNADPFNTLETLLDEPAAEIKSKHQKLSHITNRNVIDKCFLETLGIIEKPIRKINIKPKNAKTNNPIHSAGQLCAGIRSIKKMSRTEKEIIAGMLDTLKEELK